SGSGAPNASPARTGRALPSNAVVAYVLPLPCVRLSSQRTDCMGTAAHCWRNNYRCARLAVGPAFQISAWSFIDARNHCALGNPSADSNPGRILRCWNPKARHQPVACYDGRTRSEFVWNVSAVATVLFRDPPREFLSVVDQVALVGLQVVAEANR